MILCVGGPADGLKVPYQGNLIIIQGPDTEPLIHRLTEAQLMEYKTKRFMYQYNGEDYIYLNPEWAQ